MEDRERGDGQGEPTSEAAMSEQSAYPLSWPLGWKRSKSPQRSRFDYPTVSKATNHLIAELQRMGVAGYRALPEKTEDSWTEILGIAQNSTMEEIIAAYRGKAMLVHPDKGGSQEAFTKVQRAYDNAKQFKAANQ